MIPTQMACGHSSCCVQQSHRTHKAAHGSTNPGQELQPLSPAAPSLSGRALGLALGCVLPVGLISTLVDIFLFRHLVPRYKREVKMALSCTQWVLREGFLDITYTLVHSTPGPKSVGPDRQGPREGNLRVF